MSMTVYTMAREIVQREFDERLSGKWRQFCATMKLTDFNAYKTVLDQGSADFSAPYVSGDWKFTKEDKVLLYCNSYMKMHYKSSTAVFRNLCLDMSKPALMVDVGCGPGTSGFAFFDLCLSRPKWNAIVHYVGIDRSPAMLSKAKELFACCNLEHRRLEHRGFKQNLKKFPKLTKSPKFYGTIVINFSFLLTSKTHRMDRNSIEEIIETLQRAMKKYRKSSMYVVYQNPVGQRGDCDGFHSNWMEIKRQMENLVSLRRFPKPVSYDTNRKVYCDILIKRKP